MLNFEIKKSTRKCFETGRDFQPGEVFFSALVENDDGSTSRQDYGTDHWEQPPEDCIGWWKSQVPEAGKGKIYWAPRNVMLAFFKHVLEQPASQDVAFVTGLLLVQKKYLVIVDKDDDPSTMDVRDRSSKEDFTVTVADVSGQRLAEIQTLLAEQLFMDEPIMDEPIMDDMEATDAD